MDDRHLARLVDEVERAFPGDPAAQREAWEFLEAFMDEWSEVEAADAAADAESAVAGAAEDQSVTVRRLLGACRELLQDVTGRVASTLEELVPPAPAFKLGAVHHHGAGPSLSVDFDAEAAAELGVDSEITVELGSNSVTLIAGIDERSMPERLAAVLQTPERPGAPDGEAIVRYFTRLDPTLATAHFDIDPPTGPLGLALVVVDPGTE